MTARRVLGLLLLAPLCGCEHAVPVTTRHTGIIERIEEADGVAYAPMGRASGQHQMFPLKLHVKVPLPEQRGTRHIVIEVPDALERKIFGRTGDSVAFQFPGNLPVEGRIPFRAVAGFIVVPSGGCGP